MTSTLETSQKVAESARGRRAAAGECLERVQADRGKRDFEAEVDAETKFLEGPGKVAEIRARRRVALKDVDPYGPTSPHSWARDSAAVIAVGSDPLAQERLNRFRAAHEKRTREERVVSTSTLGGIVPDVLPPYVAEAVA